MRRIDRLRLWACFLCLLSGAYCVTSTAAAAAPPEPVQFRPAVYVKPPALLGDEPGAGRCPDPDQPCMKDTHDLLFGRTRILPSDDLVMASHTSLAVMPTNNSSVSVADTRALDGISDQNPVPGVVGARLFNTSTDTAVTVMREADGLHWRLDGLSGIIATNIQPGRGGDRIFTLATDLNGDGLDEVVVWLSIGSGQDVYVDGAGFVLTAVDPNDPAKGLQSGPRLDVPLRAPVGIATAVVAGQPRIMVAVHAPSSGVCFNGRGGIGLLTFTVDPKTLAISDAGQFTPNLPEGNDVCVTIAGIAAGRYASATHDQLALLYAVRDNTIKVMPIDIDPQGNFVQKPVFDTTDREGGGDARIGSGRFDWSGPVDQLALLVSNCWGCAGINTLRILSFDADLNIRSGPVEQAVADGVCSGQLVVGNFDRQQTNPTPPPATLVNTDPQIAVAFNNCVNTTYLRLFNVDSANGFAISPIPGYGIDLPGFPVSLAAADLQGRSLRVGRPDIISVEGRQQVTVVVAAPPMAVDAVVPIGGGAQRPFNITAVPRGFNAGYSFSDSNSQKTDTTTTLSWSFAAKETLDTKFTYGSCKVGDCASAGYKFAAQQARDGSTSGLNGRFSIGSQDLAVTTGFSDLVFAQGETLTIFVYPAIGRLVCPSTLQNCSDAQKVPLTVNLSGPDTLVYKEGYEGSALPWYQPVWMPGQLLSYPGNAAQLQKAAVADPTAFVALSDPGTWLVGGDGSATKRISWTGGSTTGSTSSSKQNYSFEGQLSVSGKAGLEGVIGVQTSVTLDLSGSKGFADLVNSLSTLSATQGLQLTRATSFLSDPNYYYEITPQLFGQRQPPTVVDTNSVPADVQTFGALRSGYAVNVSTGGFWQAWYGQAPDLALNQPSHWVVSLSGSDLGSGACLPIGASPGFNCVRLGDRLPTALGDPRWLSAFHWMRGLFISGPQGGGPQLTTATSGDRLLLQARVYNLSLADPGALDAHVRFMAMPWDTTNNTPAGTSFEIGEQVLDGAQLPAFNTNTANPNWALAAQPFDTSGTNCGGQVCDNLDLLFWVVVWGQHHLDGTLLAELPQHGLASIPATGEDFMAVASREQPYSNNLGIYNQAFHLFPKAAAAPSSAAAAATPGGEVGAMIVLSGTSAREVRRGESLALAVKVDTGSQDLSGGLEVDFYDGDPADGGAPMGLQYLPYLHADSRYDFRVTYRPETCGRREFYAVAGAGTRHDHSVVMAPVDVICNDMAKLAGSISAKSGTQGARRWTIAVGNSGGGPAHQAGIDGLSLTQLNGPACTPRITNPAAFPLPIGDIPPAGTGTGDLTIDFTGCAAAARFRAQIDFSSDNRAVHGTATLNNQFR